MERAMSRSSARLRSSRLADNQRPMEASSILAASSSSSPEDRGRGILLHLLQQITEFLERKEMMSSRVAVSNEWRKSRSRRRSDSSNNLFEVVIQVCEQRMRRLRRSTSGGYDGTESSVQSPRMLVAEAIVQELLVSLMEVRMKEKETLVTDQVECVEIMRQLHVHLQKDEEMVRTKVCVGAGDEEQLEELQFMLRTDFLEEVAGGDGVMSPQKQQQVDSAANNEASLQFAWETIDDQKKEIIRLRAENEELKCLERKSLQRVIPKTHKAFDGSKSTFDSSHSSEKEDWSSLLSRSTVGTDFSRTQRARRKCDECRANSASLLTLRSELKQLRVQAAIDEESLLQAEKDRSQRQRENSALSTALFSAKQKQEELREMIVDLTQEKHQLQNLGDSEQRTSERGIRILQEQLNALEEQKTRQKRKLDELSSKFEAEVSEKRMLADQYATLQDLHSQLSHSAAILEEKVKSLDEASQKHVEVVEGRDSALKELQTQLNLVEEDRAAELQKKEKLIEELNDKLLNLQLCVDNVEVEKRRAAREIERLLETLDECKRKNQRLETGFEELKQGKELLASLQQVERGASALQFSELQQVREQLKALKLQLSSSKSECSRLKEELSEADKANKSIQNAHVQEVERVQRELETMQQRGLLLARQISDQHELQSNFETIKLENGDRIENLTQELAESKTTMLLWMNKYNAISDEKQELNGDIQGLTEELYSLQRMVEELQAERDAGILEQQVKSDDEIVLQEELTALNENQRIMERECRVVDQEKKALVKLVQTLQARPELQQRAFREMLLTCQRGTERLLCELSERVTITLKKLSTVEENHQALRTRLASRKQFVSSSAQHVQQFSVQEVDFSSSASLAFDLSSSHPIWLEKIESVATELEVNECCLQTDLQNREQEVAISSLKSHLEQWKWKYVAQCLVANSNRKELKNLNIQVKKSSRSTDEMKATNCQLLKLHHLNVVVTRRLSKELQSKEQTLSFARWKNQVLLEKYQAKLRASANDPLRPSFAPSTTMALGNCIKLVRQFCEPTKSNERKKPSQTRDADELTNYLVEINTKVASWRVAVDRKVAEYAERNHQLKSLRTRCSELKDLVDLNQRLIEEMERRAAGQHSVVEAAWDFATAYKALSPSARAQVFQSRDFLSASKGIVEGLNSLGLPRSANKLSQTMGVSDHAPVRKQKENAALKRVNLLSASVGPGISRHGGGDTGKPHKKLNDSNIELLEDAVGSLKGAVQKQKILQRELKMKEQSLMITTKELEKRNLQFLMLRSFLQWKCAGSTRDRRKRRQQVVTGRGSVI